MFQPTCPLRTSDLAISQGNQYPSADTDEARAWVLSFVHWYNTQHKHSALKFTTPQQRHSGEAEVILNYREQVYQAARARHPERWSGDTRNWSLPEQVWLNPENELPDLNKAA